MVWFQGSELVLCPIAAYTTTHLRTVLLPIVAFAITEFRGGNIISCISFHMTRVDRFSQEYCARCSLVLGAYCRRMSLVVFAAEELCTPGSTTEYQTVAYLQSL